MEKKGNNKKTFAIIGIVLLVAILGLVIGVNSNAERRAQRKFP